MKLPHTDRFSKRASEIFNTFSLTAHQNHHDYTRHDGVYGEVMYGLAFYKYLAQCPDRLGDLYNVEIGGMTVMSESTLITRPELDHFVRVERQEVNGLNRQAVQDTMSIEVGGRGKSKKGRGAPSQKGKSNKRPNASRKSGRGAPRGGRGKRNTRRNPASYGSRLNNYRRTILDPSIGSIGIPKDHEYAYAVLNPSRGLLARYPDDVAPESAMYFAMFQKTVTWDSNGNFRFIVAPWCTNVYHSDTPGTSLDSNFVPQAGTGLTNPIVALADNFRPIAVEVRVTPLTPPSTTSGQMFGCV